MNTTTPPHTTQPWFESDDVVVMIISCYLHDGKYAKTLELFGEMRDCGFERDYVSYTTDISACAKVMDVERR
ncbi:pentatricopeptide repeat-containing protein [Tanacetum coccineum]